MAKHSKKKDDDEIKVPQLEVLDMGDGQTLNLDALFRHDFEEIAEACEKLPGIMEWVNTKLQEFTETKIMLSRQAKETEARAWLDYKGGKLADDFPGMSVTEKTLDKAALIHPDVVSINKKLATYSAWVYRLQNLQLSLQMKYDLIRSSEATRRKTFDEPDDLPRRRSRPDVGDESEE